MPGDNTCPAGELLTKGAAKLMMEVAKTRVVTIFADDIGELGRRNKQIDSVA